MTPVELLAKHLSFAGLGASVEASTEVYHEDAFIEFPYAPEGHTRRLDGREAIVGFLGRISSFTEGFRLGEPVVRLTDDGLIAEYPGSAIFRDSGLPYAQEYVLFLTVRDGKIAQLREYYDGLRVLRALGEIE